MDHDSNDIAFFSDSLLTPFITGATGFQAKSFSPKSQVLEFMWGQSGSQNEPIVFNLGLTGSFPIQNRKFIPIICRKLQVWNDSWVTKMSSIYPVHSDKKHNCI